jgi:predicted lipoprotein with Yx(FWY)xxD motif
MKTAVVVTALATVLVLAGVAAPAATKAVSVRSSSYGQILFDQRGFALYAFTRDRGAKSLCTGACAKAWPPYVVSRAPAKTALVGTIRRADGRLQVTYRGRPLYFYIGDRKPGQVFCRNVTEFGGVWLVLRPDGTLVR